MSDLLCFHAFENIYGIPVHIVQETFDEQRVTPVPCMHPAFSGLCNYKGIVYPVLSFSRLCNKRMPLKRACMLLLHVDKYQLILRMNDVPFFVYEAKLTKSIPYDGGSEYLKIEMLCQQEDKSIYVLNMKEILDYLAANMLHIPE